MSISAPSRLQFITTCLMVASHSALPWIILLFVWVLSVPVSFPSVSIAHCFCSSCSLISPTSTHSQRCDLFNSISLLAVPPSSNLPSL